MPQQGGISLYRTETTELLLGLGRGGTLGASLCAAGAYAVSYH